MNDSFETIRRTVTKDYSHKKITLGGGEFARLILYVEPCTPGTRFVFDNQLSGRALPAEFVPAIESGVRSVLAKGPLGFPVTGVKITLVDGKYHDVDSTADVFGRAAETAFRQALAEADPVRLTQTATGFEPDPDNDPPPFRPAVGLRA